MTSSARTTARASRAAARRLERNHPRRARARRSFARARRARASGPPLSSPRVVARRRRRRDVRFRAHPPRRRRDLTARARRADAQTRPFFSSRAPPAPGVPRPRRALAPRAARDARAAIPSRARASDRPPPRIPRAKRPSKWNQNRRTPIVSRDGVRDAPSTAFATRVAR